MQAEVVKAELWHALYVAEHCREADTRELYAVALRTPFECITGGMERGESWAGLIGGVPVCVFGVCPVGGFLSSMGRPWMVGTDLIDRYAITFLRHNRRPVKEMLGKFSYLSNFIDCRNTKAIQWLKWLGFVFDPPEPIGPFSLPFMRFEMRA